MAEETGKNTFSNREQKPQVKRDDSDQGSGELLRGIRP